MLKPVLLNWVQFRSSIVTHTIKKKQFHQHHKVEKSFGGNACKLHTVVSIRHVNLGMLKPTLISWRQHPYKFFNMNIGGHSLEAYDTNETMI